jgi:hypothetical protein
MLYPILSPPLAILGLNNGNSAGMAGTESEGEMITTIGTQCGFAVVTARVNGQMVTKWAEIIDGDELAAIIHAWEQIESVNIPIKGGKMTQTEAFKNTEYIYIGYNPATKYHILYSPEENKYENWVARKTPPAAFNIKHKGRYLEFCSTC